MQLRDPEMPLDPRLPIADAVLNSEHEAAIVVRPLREGGAVTDFEYVLVSSTATRMTADPPRVGDRMLQRYPSVAETLFPVLARVCDDQRSIEVDHPVRRVENGKQHETWLRMTADPQDGLLVLRYRNVTTERINAATVASSERRFRALVERAPDVITMIAPDGRISYSSPAIARVLGYEPAEVVGMHFGQFLDPEGAARARASLSQLLTRAGGSSGEHRLRVRAKDGSTRWAEYHAVNALNDPDVRAVIVNWRDVTERHLLQETLRHAALHDPLTGLPNRRMFIEHLDLALARLSRTSRWLALLFCDIDHFNYINDTFGHGAGDEALRQVAQRVQPVLRPADSVARIGGDEFLVLCEDLESPLDVAPISSRIHQALSGVYRIAGTDVPITFSMGVTTTNVSRGAEEVIAEADSALYEVKRSGRNRFDTFDPHVRRLVAQRVHLEQELSQALAVDRLALAYQPVMSVATGAFSGAEGLLRWQRTPATLLTADQFINVAEDSGLMLSIGGWVMSSALAMAAGWPSETGTRPQLHLNVSSRELGHPGFLNRLLQAIEASGVPAQAVTVEVSESNLERHRQQVIDGLRELRRSGVRAALDDFGSGTLSLLSLQGVPLDEVKVDLAVAARQSSGELAEEFLRAAVRTAHSLGLTVVAEGVERQRDLELLTELGCDKAQGRHLCPPLSAPDLLQRLSAGPVIT